MFARRASWDLTSNPLSEAAQARRARGAEVVDLGDANPTRSGLLEGSRALARALAAAAADPASRHYAPDPRGPRAAREAIARYHARSGCDVAPEQVLLTAGTSEGYAHLLRLLADPGDHVLVPRPGYPLFEMLAGLEGVATRGLPLRRERDGYRIDRQALVQEGARRGLRALLAIHPHNPTGAFVHADDASALRALCRERQLALISDEVFAESAWQPAAPRLATLLDDASDAPLHFVLSGASKLLALPQLKLSWIVVAGAPRLRDEALARLEAISDTYLSVSPLLAGCLPELLEARGAIEAELRVRLHGNLEQLDALTARTPGVTRLPGAAGFAAILEFESDSGAPIDEERLAIACVERAGVLAHPGFFFDFEEDARARLVVSLLPEPARFDAALRALLEVAGEESRRAARGASSAAS